MGKNICSFVVLVILSLGTAFLVYAVLRRNLEDLLDKVIRLPSATAFYTRLLFIGLLFVALSAALGVAFDLKVGSAFMEYVWKIADGLSAEFGRTCILLTAYLVLITILMAVLRRGIDQ
jgi:hypothetical protein